MSFKPSCYFDTLYHLEDLIPLWSPCLPLCYSNEQRYGDTRSGYATPDRASLPDMEDDDSDPNYARINDFRQQPSPLSLSRTPSPALPRGGQIQPQASFEDIDGLYAKVNKSRPPPASPNQQQALPDRLDCSCFTHKHLVVLLLSHSFSFLCIYISA